MTIAVTVAYLILKARIHPLRLLHLIKHVVPVSVGTYTNCQIVRAQISKQGLRSVGGWGWRWCGGAKMFNCSCILSAIPLGPKAKVTNSNKPTKSGCSILVCPHLSYENNSFHIGKNFKVHLDFVKQCSALFGLHTLHWFNGIACLSLTLPTKSNSWRSFIPPFFLLYFTVIVKYYEWKKWCFG